MQAIIAKIELLPVISNVRAFYSQMHFFLSVCHFYSTSYPLTHCGRVTHICVGNLTIIGSDNGLSPERRRAIIWTNAGILLIGPLGTNFSEILIEIQTFSLKKMRLKMSSAKCCSFRLGLNVLMIRKCAMCRDDWHLWGKCHITRQMFYSLALVPVGINLCHLIKEINFVI